MNERIENWLKKQKEALREDVISWGYEEGSERFTQQYTRECGNLDKTVTLIEELVEKKDLDTQRRLYPYFENLSNNRRIAFLFYQLTGISVGKSNKRGIEAFVEYFGDAVPREVEAKENDAKQAEAEEKEKERLAKIDEKTAYLGAVLWDQEKVGKLTPLQFGRIKKVLDKLWNFNGKVQSMKDHLLACGVTHKSMSNNMWKWNRKKYHGMDGREQREYDAKLIKGRTYYANYGDYSTDIPKILFDLMDVQDKTNIESLAS